MWYVENGCSKHMTRDQNKFLEFKKDIGGMVTFGNDGSGQIVGKGIVQLEGEKDKAKYVLLVENMKHDLLIVSKMCDQEHILIFYSQKYEVRRDNSRKLVVTIDRTPKNVYILDDVKREKCYLGQFDKKWIWNKRMGEHDCNSLAQLNIKKVVETFLQL